MSERTNLNATENPLKYIVGSMFLLLLSGVGMFWLTGQSKKELAVKENTIIIEPTKAILPAPTVVETDNEATASTEITTVPTVATSITNTPSESLSPTLKPIEEYRSTEGGFLVKYKGTRKVYEENETSGKRYIFYSTLGNITVHVGKTWSWVTSGRTFSDSLMVGGEKSYVYDISNQKIVDVEKGDNKYTIQCVHNSKQELKDECQQFLEDFNFI